MAGQLKREPCHATRPEGTEQSWQQKIHTSRHALSNREQHMGSHVFDTFVSFINFER